MANTASTAISPYSYNPYLQTASKLLSGGQTAYAPPAVQAPNINQQNAALGRLGGYRPATSQPPVSSAVASPVGVGAQQVQPMQPQPIPVDWNLAGMQAYTPYAPGPYQATSAYQGAPPAEAIRPGSGRPATTEAEQRQLEYQQSLLGPELSSVLLPGGGSRSLQYRDIPLVETRLAYETQQQAEADRQRAYDEMVRSWMGVGTSPESMMAKQAATQFLQEGGPYTPGLMEQLQGSLRNQAGVAQQGILRQSAEDYARRGLSGGLSGYEQAMLQQQGALGLQGQLSDLSQQAALANQEARRAALGDLTQMAQYEQQQRTAIDQLIAQLFAGTEREAPSLAQFIETVKQSKQGRSVGF